jgi:hypothetical protein
MTTFTGTAGNDSWTVVGASTFTLNGLGGVDTLSLGTSERTSYSITKSSDGAVHVDSVSAASGGALHATLLSIEKLVFDSGRDTLDLTTYFAQAAPVGLSIIGGAGNDNLLGGAGDDTITGLSGDDTITGGAGNDQIDAGSGNDVVVYSGQRASYTVAAANAASVTVSDRTGADGNDTVSNAEHLQFSDMSVNLRVGSLSRSIPAASLQTLEELYVGFFNRIPDADGMAYWIGQFAAGSSIKQIGESFYVAAVQFSNLTGYSPTMSNAAFVTVVYKNVLGRSSVDQGGLDYWTTALANGSETHGSLVASILTSAHTFKGDPTFAYVADLLDNKLAVATAFAIQQGLTYLSSDASITNGMAIAAAVTSSSTAEALGLIGVNDPAFMPL